MSLACIIQARVGSTRLPGKVLMPLCGVPIVTHVIRRACAPEVQMRVVLAIPDTPENDELAAIGAAEGVLVYRGSEDDVLARYWGAANLVPDADAIVRLTGEDPFKDPWLIDAAVHNFLAEWADPRGPQPPPNYLWLGGPTWPVGLDVEVFTRAALDLTFRAATAPGDREHVTLWMRRNLGAWVMKNPTGIGSSRDRWTVDTGEDYVFATRVYERLYRNKPLFGFHDMIEAGVLKEAA